MNDKVIIELFKLDTLDIHPDPNRYVRQPIVNAYANGKSNKDVIIDDNTINGTLQTGVVFDNNTVHVSISCESNIPDYIINSKIILNVYSKKDITI